MSSFGIIIMSEAHIWETKFYYLTVLTCHKVKLNLTKFKNSYIFREPANLKLLICGTSCIQHIYLTPISTSPIEVAQNLGFFVQHVVLFFFLNILNPIIFNSKKHLIYLLHSFFSKGTKKTIEKLSPFHTVFKIYHDPIAKTCIRIYANY